ncbi:ketopantoate reductase family protein [Acetobacterium woodii]|uniref:2-dehydropantoate 2-reductase n=1 Tax=Acetobacterium woodii (strain ATCC 29683 / DSM 1030 / JCM 2381 / KCTC 1655 / WB1) TaxID=931626 RepID=H6LGL8_ACEWD|nr:ketopantoate reductase family protein [Acetobacterium woodii]AFA48346.1 2-dehydropantoate 2-reductase ApbA [Acetobacterium woodii DSM 1030]
MEIEKVSIIGLGALGILFGDLIFQKISSDLTIIADQKRIEKYKTEGVFCNQKRCDFNYLSPEDETVIADLIIFCVKINGLKEAIQAVEKHVGPNTIFISLLNGITSETIIGEHFGEKNLVWSVAQGMDTVKVENQLHYTNPGIICFGNRNSDEPSSTVKRVKNFFDKVGIAYQIDNQMERKIWSKFMLNVGINQVVSVFGENFGSVQKMGELRDLMIAAMAEVIPLAQKEGIDLNQADINYWLGVVDALDAKGKPSMRQDVEARRPSEVELFSGTVIQLGKKYGIVTPVNEMLYNKIKKVESSY